MSKKHFDFPLHKCVGSTQLDQSFPTGLTYYNVEHYIASGQKLGREKEGEIFVCIHR